MTPIRRVEDWRVSVRVRWLFRHFRSGPQSGSRDHVSSPRSSNRTCGFPASYVVDNIGCEDLAGYPLGWMLDACRDAVQPFFDLEEWIDIEIYDPLIEVLERLLNQNGMYTRAHGDSIYVDMPYTGFHDL